MFGSGWVFVFLVKGKAISYEGISYDRACTVL